MLPATKSAPDDIVRLNCQAAAGLPGLGALDEEWCVRTIDVFAAMVQAETQRQINLYARNPARFGNCFAHYQMEALVTVLQRDLHVRYNMDTLALSDQDFHKDARNLFIRGAFTGHGGTCSSLPPLYIGVGRRLGYPLKLVATSRHLFARWEEPNGPRFNVECTSRGFVSQPDEHFRTFPTKLTDEEVARYGFLRSLSSAGEAAAFWSMRARWMMAHDKAEEALDAYAKAADLDPETPLHRICFDEIADKTEAWQRSRLMPGFPALRVVADTARFKNLDQQTILRLSVLMLRQRLLVDAEADRRWWEPLRRDRTRRPEGLPAFVKGDFTAKVPGGLRIEFLDKPPGDYEHSKAKTPGGLTR